MKELLPNIDGVIFRFVGNETDQVQRLAKATTALGRLLLKGKANDGLPVLQGVAVGSGVKSMAHAYHWLGDDYPEESGSWCVVAEFKDPQRSLLWRPTLSPAQLTITHTGVQEPTEAVAHLYADIEDIAHIARTDRY